MKSHLLKVGCALPLFLLLAPLAVADNHYFTQVMGENCFLRENGKRIRHNFIVGRAVRAVDEGEAEKKALALVRNEIASRLVNENDEVPDIYVTKVTDSTEDEAKTTNLTGYAWLPQKD